jgi:hypothetical protein
MVFPACPNCIGPQIAPLTPLQNPADSTGAQNPSSTRRHLPTLSSIYQSTLRWQIERRWRASRSSRLSIVTRLSPQSASLWDYLSTICGHDLWRSFLHPSPISPALVTISNPFFSKPSFRPGAFKISVPRSNDGSVTPMRAFDRIRLFISVQCKKHDSASGLSRPFRNTWRSHHSFLRLQPQLDHAGGYSSQLSLARSTKNDRMPSSWSVRENSAKASWSVAKRLSQTVDPFS